MLNKKDSTYNKNHNNIVSKWIDSIYELFQTEEENTDHQNLDDNISYEASQIRLIILGSIFATLFSSIATIQIASLLRKNGPTQPMVLIYQPETKPRFPHIALIYSTGKMNIYEFNSTDHIVHKANFTLQKVRDIIGYFAFEDQNSIRIICSDMRKVQSIIDGHNQYYSTDNTNDDIKRILTGSGHTRVGNFLWIFGGYETQSDDWNGSTKNFNRTLLWHIKKQIWIWGPWIPQKLNISDDSYYSIKGASGIAIDRTTGMIVFPNFNQPYCLAYMIYDFKAFNWTDVNVCFFKLDKKLDGYSRLATMKSLSSFDKSGVMYEFFLKFIFSMVCKQT